MLIISSWKQSSKQMVMMNGTLSFGYGSNRRTCQRASAYQGRACANRLSWPVQQRREVLRRLYIPKTLRIEATKWIKEKELSSGYIFLNRFGQRITTRGIAQQLKHFAEKYGLNRDVVYPHSFRHRFAKNFLDRFNDLALLADLMGHESIETTRIYLRRTASEQQKIVDRVVNW